MTENRSHIVFTIPHKKHLAAAAGSQVETMESTFRQLLETVLCEGYYGSAGIQLTIQNGVIQTISYRNEQTQRCVSKP